MSSTLDHRYGTGRRPGRAIVLAIAAILGVLLLAWVGWAGWDTANPPVNASVTSYRVVNAHEVQVRIAATFRSEDTQARCLLRATAEDHNVVGELNLSGDALRAAIGTWISVRTERTATAVELVGCAEVAPAQ